MAFASVRPMSVDREPTAGDVLADRYRLRREIARGGMGIVFEAEHAFTGRTVAVKVLIGELAASPAIQRRLIREAEVLGAVHHPSVVEVLDAGYDGRGRPFVVMEMLEGRTLEGILMARGTLSLDETVAIARPLCEALSFVHACGIVHRDVKPANVIVARDRAGREVIKLIDFGIASLQGEASSGNTKLTLLGGLVGTPGYMPREQVLAQPVDRAADLFAVGALLFECLAGRLPFPGAFHETAPLLIAGALPPSISSLRPDVPRALDAVMARALAPLATDRHATALDLARELIVTTGLRGESTNLLGLPAAPLDRPAVPNTTNELPIELQRRRHPRVPYVTPVQLWREGKDDEPARCEEISESGMLVVADGGFVNGERARVAFALPCSGESVVLDASVRWVRAARGRTAFGLEFQGAPPAVTAHLRAFAVQASGAR